MASVRYRGIYKPFEPEKKRVKGKMKTAEPVQFVEVEQQPRYYFADQIVTIRDRRDFVNKLVDGSYSRSVAFVKQPSFVPARGIVHGVHETANTARLDVESFGNAWLVMSVTPHKYWQVTIDGHPIAPRITNIAFQGLPVPAGRHRIEMRYRNTLAVTAMKISIVAIVILLLAAFLPRRRVYAAP
jgi:uncharacterized membrane protein YfhO